MYFCRHKTVLKRNFFTKRSGIIFICICFSVLLLLQTYTKWNFSRINQTVFDKKPPLDEVLAYKCCTPMNNSVQTNIFFLKTHKTGGTTVQSVLTRFAIMNSLDIMNVNYESYYSSFSDASLFSEGITPNNKYNVLAEHARYDSNIKSYQYPNTPMVTILRHPVKLFPSLYTFFRMDKTSGMTFRQFLDAPTKPAFVTGFDSEMAYRGYNQMSVDLGFDLKQNRNTTAIAEFIEKIDREFDFVMITEHMDESFVLLANLMGWPLEYVASLRLNARLTNSESYYLTPQDELTIMDLNQADTLLYNHFLKKFQKCKRQYGEDNLNQQVQQLQIINKSFKERCVTSEVMGLNRGNLPRIEYIPKNLFDKECFYSMQTSPVLGTITRLIQAQKVLQLKQQQNRH